MFLVITLFLTFCLSFYLTGKVKEFALKFNIVDDPKLAPHRKKQTEPIPLIGALGFSVSVILIILILFLTSFYLPENTQALSTQSYFSDSSLYEAILSLKAEAGRIVWIFVSLIILSVGGYLDDKYNLPAKWQMLVTCVYILVSLFGANLIITNFSYPFSQLLPNIYWIKALLSFSWIWFCVNATKILDGLDGLVALVGFVGFLLVTSVSFLPQVSQALPAVLAMLWAAAIAGFLPFNFPNAKVYLGQGGSELIGFLLAVFALWSGAKVATVSMGIGLFILDILLVVMLRLRSGRSIFEGDRFHWHHRLYDLGLTKIQVLAVTGLFLVTFGSFGLALETRYKGWLILAEIVLLLGLLFWSNYIKSIKNGKK